jgi:hypothetical protein
MGKGTRYGACLALVLGGAALSAWSSGCGGGGGSGFGDGGLDGTTPTDDAAWPDACTGFGCGGDAAAKTLDVQPATATLSVVNGVPQTQAFTVKLDGVDVTTQVSWSFERPEIGDVSGATFTPTGKVGGVGVLTATLGKATGTATVTVKIDLTVNTGGLSVPQQTALATPNGGADPITFLYPFDETFFPLGVLPPEMMWNGAAPGDVYRLRITEKYLTYTEYFTAAPPSRHIIPQQDWKSITESGSGPTSDPLKIELTRMSGATVYQPKVFTWHVAQGRLRGSVYYWELPDACGSGDGRILRIKPDSTTVDQFYQPGGCWGCHTVSRDGTTMMATLDTNVPFPQVSIDLTKTPAVQGSITPATGLGGTFSAYNDKGDRIIVSNDAAQAASQKLLRIVDATTGAVQNPNAMGNGCGEPAWSGDGKTLAAICNLTGTGWAFDSNGGDLVIADVSGATVTNLRTIVPKGSGTGRPAYPSFDPTSKYIAFGRPTVGSRSTGAGDLWLTDLTGAAKKLATASSDNKSFNPVFAPLRAGGYSWIVFISRRDYGNRLVSANRQQLWIAAIDDPPTAPDPSHPPFYMRGQEDCGKSENAYYALDPCKKKGESCESGMDCCSGQCVKDPNTMKYVCGDPTTSTCAQDGNKCMQSTDCCNFPSSQCIDGFCQKPAPK